jgi:hypothetical protein
MQAHSSGGLLWRRCQKTKWNYTMIIVKTMISYYGNECFSSTQVEATETAKQYRINGGHTGRINKASMMVPNSIANFDSYPVYGHIWHLPEQEAEAKALLIEFCRKRIQYFRDKAEQLNKKADAGEAFIASLTAGEE